MKRVKLIVAYDGTNYCGWQVQDNGVTIQGMLNQHLSELLNEEIKTIGASRTDSGVHALGNVAVFDTNTQMPIDKISFALNARLPEDIKIQSSEEVDKNFHPRFRRTVKTYEYRILNRTFADPTCRLNTFFYYGKLDAKAMEVAASYLVGEHNFKGFATDNPQTKGTIREIYKVELKRQDDIITFRITGNGFLYNMVRIIVGTLIEIGKGTYQPEQVKLILRKRDRNLAGPTARALGLTLINIEYPQVDIGEMKRKAEKRWENKFSAVSFN
jgi:pseudouridylate synthase I